MRRLAIILASIALIAAGFFLWQMTREVSPDETEAKTSKRDTSPAPVKSAPAEIATAGARDARVAPIGVPVRRPPTSPSASEAPPSASPSATPPDPAEVQRMQTRGWLKTQVVATEQQIVECLDKAGKGAAKLDGAVAFPFVVSRKNGKIVTESGSSDYTTVGDPEVVNCMAGVMKKMSYDELPDGVGSVTSYRKITVKDGVVVEDWLGPHESADAKPSPR